MKRRDDIFKLIAEKTNDLIAMATLGGFFTYISPSHKQLGYEPDDLIGKYSFDFIHPDDKKRLRKLQRRYSPKIVENIITGSGDDIYEKFECRFSDRSGNWQYLETSANIVKSITGKGYDILLISRNVTDRKLYEASIARVNNALVSLGSDFSDNIRILLSACADIMHGAAAVLFNRIEDGIIRTVDHLNTPPDFETADDSKGHVCADIIRTEKKGERVVIKDLQKSKYARTDPHVRRYGLKTYIGCVVYSFGKPAGTLCAVFDKDIDLKESDKRVMSILAQAVSREEERRKVHEMLEISEEKYRTLVENTGQLIEVVDRKGVLKFMNQESAKQLGGVPGDFIGKNIHEILPEQRANEQLEAVRFVIESGKPVSKDFESEFKGEKRWFELSMHPVKKDASVDAVFLVATDITERREAEQTIRRFQDIVTNMQVGLYVYQLMDVDDDRTLTLIAANPAAEELTRVKNESMIGKTIDIIFPQLRRRGIPAMYADVVRYSKKMDFEEVFYSDDRIKETCFSVKAFPLPNNCVGVSFEDISDRKKAEKEVFRSQEQLEKINKELKWKIEELEAALNHIKRLEGLIPICMNCKKMRLDGGSPKDPDAWIPLEKYIMSQTDAHLTHGLCPDCVKKMFGERKVKKKKG